MTCDTQGLENSDRDNSNPNLRVVCRPELRGGTKSLRAGSGIQVGCPFLDNTPGNASLTDYLRWTPRSWPIEAWECRVILSPYVEKVRFFLAGRCEVVSTKLRSPERSTVSPGPSEPLRSWLGWTPLLRTPSSGGWLFRGQYEGSSFLLRLCPQWTGFLGVPTALLYAHGRRVAVGPQTEARSWELLQDLWKAIAPQMAPWCADGVMPTCANLNYYGGSGSCVRWHSDDEVLFGVQEESKLIVSVSIGFSALFRWKPRPSPDCEADSTWLNHFDLLVMDGRCQDEYLHSTDPRLDGERVNVTFRWVKNHLPQCPLRTGAVCCLPTCAKGLPVSVCAGQEGLVCFSGWVLLFLLGMGLLLAFLALVGLWQKKSMNFWVVPSWSLQGTYLSRCHARETPGGRAGLGFGFFGVGGGRGEVLGFWEYKGNRGTMPGTLAKVWPPILFSYDACLVFWPSWASGGNNGRPKRETSFPSPLPRGITWVFSESDFYETFLGEASLGFVDREGQASWACWFWSPWFGSFECGWLAYPWRHCLGDYG